jgi:hypothetical protein
MPVTSSSMRAAVGGGRRGMKKRKTEPKLAAMKEKAPPMPKPPKGGKGKGMADMAMLKKKRI